MKKKWLIASIKINQAKRAEANLLNQKFDYYLPKITKKSINSKTKEEALFPGYIFVKTNLENYSSVKYTMGISSIIKFGDKISCISDEDIESIQMVEEASKKDPIASQVKIGQDVLISEGSLKGSIVKICSLPSNERVSVLLTFLGTMRKVNIPIKDLNF